MAEAEKAIIDRLLGDSEVTAFVGSRIFFTQAPQAPVLPYVVIFRVGTNPIHSLELAAGLLAARLQVDIFAKTAKSTRDIARVVKTNLDGFRGTQSGVDVQSVLLLDSMDGYEEASELQRVTQDYRVWYKE